MGKLLLVDDDDFLSETITECLIFVGYEVMQAASGAAALELLGKEEFDLVLLDWQLPDMQGLDVLKEYRNRGGVAKILFLTGMRDNEHLVISAGADGFLAKPFAIDDLTRKISKLIEQTTVTS